MNNPFSNQLSLNEDAIRFNRKLPRYTSYPTALFFSPIDPSLYEAKLSLLKGPVSLYIHIPFCRKMCLFCACSVVLNRSAQRQQEYVNTLLQEIALVAKKIPRNVVIKEVHFGGGTPTNLTESQFIAIFSCLEEEFSIANNAEYSIEIDPRTVIEKESLPFLRTYFSRVSFGVQDLASSVQKAVARNQSAACTIRTFEEARKCGFLSINIDLIYGLPKQTKESFAETTETIRALSPDRIALFSYAKVPSIKPHQKAIKEKDLPSEKEKWAMYIEARKVLEQSYVPIGMDHFAKPLDSLTQAYKNNNLYRNFQGYSAQNTETLLGFGVSSIGSFTNSLYIQNTKDIAKWTSAIEHGILPIERGIECSFDDQRRYRIIQAIMCKFFYTFSLEEQKYFHKELVEIGNIPELAFLQEGTLYTTALGKVFIRNVAAVFDAYLQNLSTQKYSYSL